MQCQWEFKEDGRSCDERGKAARAQLLAMEKEKVEKIAKASRAFLAVWDEFDGDPGACGEDLNALIEAVDDFGD
jgi:hypothetical protein